jgi:hypothetical protein
MTLKPEVTRDLDALHFAYESGVAFSFRRLREERGGLSADLTVTYCDEPLHWSNLGLASTSARDRLATTLKKKTTKAKELAPFDWDRAIAQTCHMAALEYRQPAPLVNLSEVEDSVHPGYLVRPILPRQQPTVLFADGSSGKSILAAWLSVAVSSSVELPKPLKVIEPGRVLYLDWETHSEICARHVRRIAAGFGVPVPKIFYREMRAPLEDELSSIRAEVAKNEISLLIIDSLGAACAGDLNDAATAIRTMNTLRQIPTTKLVVHHITHWAAQRNGAADPFGSRYFRNLARSAWELRRSEQDDEDFIRVGLFHSKVNEGRLVRHPIGLELSFEGEDGPIIVNSHDVTNDADLAGRLPLSYRIERALRSGKKTADELANELEAQPDSIRKTLSRMKAVIRLSEGGGRGNVTIWGLKESLP